HAVAQAAQQRADGAAERLALEVPARDVQRRERQREDATGAGAAGRATAPGGDRLGLGGILADDEGGQPVDGGLERGGERAAEEREAEADEALVGPQPEGAAPTSVARS